MLTNQNVYLITAVANGLIATLFAFVCFLLAVLPIPADIAREIIAGLLPTSLICAAVGLFLYRKHWEARGKS